MTRDDDTRLVMMASMVFRGTAVASGVASRCMSLITEGRGWCNDGHSTRRALVSGSLAA